MRGCSSAGIVSYTDSASFSAALGSIPTMFDFAAFASNTVFADAADFGALLISAGLAGSGINSMISSAADQTTAAGRNALGLDTVDETFSSGDVLTFTFA